MLAKIINLIADHDCLICQRSGPTVCFKCVKSLTPKVQTCFLCNKLSENGKTCTSCKRKSKISGVTIAYRLEENTKELIYQLKYFGRRDLAYFFAEEMLKIFTVKNFDLITFVPSDGRAMRRRGYNQAKLLAKEFSRKVNLPLKECLIRLKHTSQIGQGREQRFRSVKDNFLAKKSCKNKNILIIDDVLTTGATLDECALMLNRAGAKKVWGLVVAKK